MSFEYTCFYILTTTKIDSSRYGDISGPFSKTEIEKNYKNEYNILLSNVAPTIITDISNFSNKHLVGIPTRNHNMISRNKLYFYMVTYNIGALLSIRPYIQSLESNDTGEGSQEICINPIDKKKLTSQGSSHIRRTTTPENIALQARGHITPYRYCIFRR